MRFNDRIQVISCGDPFPLDVVAAEPAYTALPLDKAREMGPLSARVAEILEARLNLDGIRDRLRLRCDKFILTDRSKRQPLHYDNPLELVEHWRVYGLHGLIAFGAGTGVTDVPRPFSLEHMEDKPLRGFGEFAQVASIMEARHPYYPMDSHPTGTLLMSEFPFLHGRGECSVGPRAAIDFGLVY